MVLTLDTEETYIAEAKNMFLKHFKKALCFQDTNFASAPCFSAWTQGDVAIAHSAVFSSVERQIFRLTRSKVRNTNTFSNEFRS